MLAPGTSVGRYLVERKVAEGGMAEIYLATARGPAGFSKEVVLKVVRSYLATDPQFVELFIAEARLASRLNHANVVQIFDFGKHDDTYYLAMEYVRGASLWKLRLRCRELGVAFPVTLAAELCARVAAGLHAAHSLTDPEGQLLGVVHRDVSPPNILLAFDGAVKLTDFGIAKATSLHTSPGVLKGKLAYMSPEQSRGDPIDARTDIFALGVVLWELLTGGRLFDAETDQGVLRAVQQSAIAPPMRLNPDVPQELSEAVMKALDRDPAKRFQTAFEFERALTNFVLAHAQSMEDTALGPFLQNLCSDSVVMGTPLPTESGGSGGEFSPLAPTVAARRLSDPAAGPEKTELPPVARPDVSNRRFDPLPVGGGTISEKPLSPSAAAFEAAAKELEGAPRRRVIMGLMLSALLGAGASVLYLSTRPAVVVVQPTAPAPPEPAVDAGPSEPRVDAGPSEPRADAGPSQPLKPGPAPIASPKLAGAPRPRPSGVLSLYTDPWSKVYLNGKLLGDTPRKFELPSGLQELLLVNEAQNLRRTIEVDIQPGQTTEKKLKL